jgi:hypothetical protein
MPELEVVAEHTAVCGACQQRGVSQRGCSQPPRREKFIDFKTAG